MKQSTKLLSLVLAFVMALSCMSVIGSAASSPVTRDNMTYDSVDDAILTPDQVAGIICDMLDNELLPSAGLDLVNESFLGINIIIDLSSVDNIFKTFDTIMDLQNLAGGDIADLNNTGVYYSGTTPRTRANSGDLNCLLNAVYFLGNSNNAGILSKAANGLLEDGGLEAGTIITTILGWIGLELDDINNMIYGIPSVVNEMVYDMLIYGSYNASYENASYPSVEDLTAEGADNATLPTDVDSVDEILNQAVVGILSNPQNYEWVDTDNDETTDNSVKEWDLNSYLLPSIAGWEKATVADFFNLFGSSTDYIGDGSTTNSLFELLDKLAPFAIYDLGIPSLNYNLKKTLMQVVGVEFNEIKADAVPADVKAIFDAEEYVTYIAYDCLEKSSDGNWYYTTFKSVPTGEVDEETGEEITEKQHVYYKANVGGANVFYSMINWDWEFFAYEPYRGLGDGDGKEDVVNGAREIDYTTMVKTYGSIFGSLNHLLYVLFNNALTTEAQETFKAMTTDGWVDGDNTNLNENLVRFIKYLLAEHADSIFGKNSAYIDWTYDDVKDRDLIDLVAIIGPSFFEDVMPQLIIPQNADGTYAFGDDDQLLKFASIVVREFASEVSPTTNYDAYIFEDGTVTSADGRFFKESNKTDDWYNIILNMGLDIAYTYLNNITNFNTATPAVAITEDRWMGMLDAIVTWAVNYIGSGDESIINGLEPNTVAAKGDAFGKLSYILNTLLPLGFVNGCTANGYDFDVATFFGKVKSFFTTVDFEILFGLFGRNSDSAYNPLQDVNVPTMVLTLVNDILSLVIGNDLLPYENSISANLTNIKSSGDYTDGLQKVIYNLLNGLNNRIAAVANGLLPVLAKFVSGWGTEQQFGNPTISLENSATVASGTTSYEANLVFRNGSKGIWRGYKASADAESHSKDEQYKYVITGLKAYNVDGTVSENVTFSDITGEKVDFGGTQTLTMTFKNIPTAGMVQRIEVSYQVTDEDGKILGGDDEVFTVSAYCALDQGSPMASSTNSVGSSWTSDHYTNFIFDATSESLADDIAATNAYKLKLSTTVRTSRAYYNITPTANNGVSVASQAISVSTGITGYSETSFKFVITDADALAAAAESAKAGLVTVAPSWHYQELKNTTTNAEGDHTAYIYLYDGQGLSMLKNLVSQEFIKARTPDAYKSSGTVYAGEVLSTSYNYLTEEFDGISNFSATAIDPEGNANEKVTAIDVETAVSNYFTAFENAAKAAYAVEFDGNQQFNFRELYAKLQVAINDLSYCGKTAEDYAAEGGGLNSEILALEKKLLDVEATWSTDKDYTDYMMYRWSRYNDVRDDAKSIINKYYNANKTESDLTKYFTYTSIGTSELEKLVDGDKYEEYILALLEDYTEEEIAANREALEEAKTELSLVEAIDVAQVSGLLDRIPARLLERNGGTKDISYLSSEITSAKNVIGTENNGKYTERSWTKYIDAYNYALEVQANPTQMKAFDAKWELLTARNELVLVDEEADYSELEALIAQATQALANGSLYDNTNEELGKVLAELGYTVDGTDLFPGSALYINAEPYAADDQKNIDRAATALKEALANLKFKGLAFTGAQVTTETLVEGNEEEGIDAVTASVARIAALQDADAVKALLGASATGANVVDLTVSADGVYTIDTAIEKYTGTNSTVTFYTEVDGIKVPVATVKIVVDADVNGDGVLDVLDGALTELASNEHAELEGCYKIAANLDTATADIGAADYTAVVNAIVAA